MRRVQYSGIGIGNELVATKPYYASIVKRIATSNTSEVLVGISLAITAKSYDIYLALVANGVVNPKDYEDTRLDVITIAKSLIDSISYRLNIVYKDLLMYVEEAVNLTIKPYDSATILFYNKVTEIAIPQTLIKPTLSSEIIYTQFLKVLEAIETDKLTYNAELQEVNITDSDSSVSSILGV